MLYPSSPLAKREEWTFNWALAMSQVLYKDYLELSQQFNNAATVTTLTSWKRVTYRRGN